MEKQPVINYGIIATIPNETNPEQLSVLHFVGFETEPTEELFHHVYVDLKTTPEFGLMDVDFDLHEAPASFIEEFKKEMENDGE